MLLTGSESSRTLIEIGARVNPEDTVALHFEVATPEGYEIFKTQVRVVRLLETGNAMGVRFIEEGLPQSAFDALVEFAFASREMPRNGQSVIPGVKEQAQEISVDDLRDRRISADDASMVRRKLRSVTRHEMNLLCNQLFETATAHLMEQAYQASPNVAPGTYFEGLDHLRNDHETIRSDFISEVDRLVDQIASLDEVLGRRWRRVCGSASKPDITDADQFEEWLSLAEIISKVERRYYDELLDLRARLGLIAKPWSHKDMIPVGPAVLIWAFDDALKGVNLGSQVRQEIYRCLEKILVPTLSELYSVLGNVLEDVEVFPPLKELRESLQRTSIRRGPSGVRIEPESRQETNGKIDELRNDVEGDMRRSK